MEKIAKTDVYEAIAEMNGFHSTQKVTDWYWSGDELVFCTNKNLHETEHYYEDEFCQQMGGYFGKDLSGCRVDYDDGWFIFPPKGIR